MLTRRKLIGGLGLLIAAPAVIRVAQLMPIKAFSDDLFAARQIFLGNRQFIDAWPTEQLFVGDIVVLEQRLGLLMASRANMHSTEWLPKQLGIAT